MLRRLLLPVTFIVAGFVAGLVVTGRMRTAADSQGATREIAAPQAAPAERPAAPSNATAPVAAGGPDFTRVAAQAVRGVANISSVTVVRTRQSPFPDDEFFRY